MNTGAVSFCTLCLWQPHQASPATANFFINSFTTKHRKLAASKCSKIRASPIRLHHRGSIFCSLEQNPCSGSSDGGGKRVPEANGDYNSVIKRFGKPIACVIFCLAVSLLPIPRIQAPALAAPVAVELKEEEEVVDRDYTKRLLEAVSVVLRSIDEIKRGNGSVKELDAALKDVKAKKEEFEEQIMERLEEELQKLKKEKDKLIRRSESMVKEAKKVKWQYEEMTKKGEKEKEKAGVLVEKMGELDEKYEKIWDRLGDVEDSISRKETAAFSIGIREICFIERECEALVKRFKRDLMQKDTHTSLPAGPITRLSKDEIQRDLENAQRKYMAQMLLPRVMDNEESDALLDEDLVEFAVRIKQGLEEGREVQRDAEASIRENMKKFGDEKRFLVKTPPGEVVKGYPEIELKWMFGDKEVVVPKATNVHLYHGWKKWREEVKADLKKSLLDDVDFGKQYMAQRQERVLLERDRVVSKTWYNEEKSRWEIDPVAVPYAVSKKLVDSARIRHDWGIMYLTLKGDTVEYYVDIKAYDMLFEEFGGFDGLYLKMLASGVPTSVQLMWIPFSELSLQNQFLLAMKITSQCFIELWKNQTISSYRDDIFERYRTLYEDLAVTIVVPVVDLLLPYAVRMQLGIAWPDEINQNVGSTPTWYLSWLYEADKNFHERYPGNFVFFQYIWLMIRTYVYGYILLHVLRFLKKNIPRLPGVYFYLWMFFGPLRRSPNYRKLRRLKAYVKYKRRRFQRRKKAGRDPIRTAFDSMKRVKNPPIPLKNFSSIESMKDEINEVVAFLQNPRAFQEMGARAPRGVLIVGERGTGKTSLALAIAAEAKVPVVNIKAKQLEPGLWVGQSASNVRDLFQTARDLAPVIIFVEDFELFAGVRGKFIHTKNQDHEALINQLLVELDGFENQDGVVLMATTKNLKQVDSALKRPGRMDRIFRLQNLSPTEREKILRVAAKETMDEEIVDFVDWKKVADKTSILRPIELKLVPVALEGSAFRSKFVDTDELMSYVSWFATFGFLIPTWIRKRKFAKKLSRMLVNHLGLSLTKEDLQNVVDLMEPYGQISNGIEFLNPPIDWTRESKFPHAVWAAGRGLIAHLLPNYDVVETLWLEPTSWQGIGCTKITKARTGGSVNGNSQSRSHLEKKLVFCFGSYVAAQLLLPLGEENLLSAQELRKAQAIATKMVIQYGWGPDDSPAVYVSRKSRRTMNMGDAHEQEIAAKVEKMFDLAYSRARQMIQRNRRALEQIVEELLEFEVLTGKDMQRILETTGGSREKEPFSLVKVYDTQPTTSGFLEGGNGSSSILLGAPSN